MTWMDRAGRHPWSLMIHCQDWHKRPASQWDRNIEGDVPLLQLLARPPILYATRLTILGDRDSVGFNEIPFPRVESLVLSCCHWSPPMAPDEGPKNLMPNLRKAVLDFICDPHFITRFPLSNLTHLYVRGLTARQWRGLFRLCTALQEGCFEISTFFEDEQEVLLEILPGEITLPDLRELTFVSSSGFEQSLSEVNLPALTKLRLFTHWEPILWNMPKGSDHKTFEHLTHFTFMAFASTFVEDLINIFSSMPNLVELLFHLEGGFNEMFEFLTFDFNEDRMCNLPHLGALGMWLSTIDRTIENDPDEEFGDAGRRIVIPYHLLDNLICSRTKAVDHGKFESVTRLQRLVIGLHETQWADEEATNLETELGPVAEAQNLDFSIYRDSETFLAGNPPSPLDDRPLTHWDEGFMDFIDKIDIYQCTLVAGRREI